MQILKNENLKKYTSVKIGGIAENLFFPENEKELVELLNNLVGKKYYIISGGSNILINDKRTFENVISMTKMDTSINDLGDGVFYAGASVRIQKLISTINKKGYCGIEYLYSLPSLVGGNIVMNAGRGRKHGLSISDYITSVRVYRDGKVFSLDKDACGFKYRTSIFKDSDYVVLGASFIFDEIDENDTSRMTRQERMEFSKAVQDYSGPSFGSVFSQHDRILMQIFKFTATGYKNGMQYSKKTSNWLTNKGEGDFSQAIKLIEKVKKAHKIIGKKAIPEVRIWN